MQLRLDTQKSGKMTAWKKNNCWKVVKVLKIPVFSKQNNIYRAVKSNMVKGLFLFVFVCLFNLFILIQFGNPDLKNAFFCCAG